LDGFIQIIKPLLKSHDSTSTDHSTVLNKLFLSAKERIQFVGASISCFTKQQNVVKKWNEDNADETPRTYGKCGDHGCVVSVDSQGKRVFEVMQLSQFEQMFPEKKGAIFRLIEALNFFMREEESTLSEKTGNLAHTLVIMLEKNHIVLDFVCTLSVQNPNSPLKGFFIPYSDQLAEPLPSGYFEDGVKKDKCQLDQGEVRIEMLSKLNNMNLCIESRTVHDDIMASTSEAGNYFKLNWTGFNALDVGSHPLDMFDVTLLRRTDGRTMMVTDHNCVDRYKPRWMKLLEEYAYFKHVLEVDMPFTRLVEDPKIVQAMMNVAASKDPHLTVLLV
jgi:hypothetical protein